MLNHNNVKYLPAPVVRAVPKKYLNYLAFYKAPPYFLLFQPRDA